ncbi:MAG: class I SAM-dependent methyltransferase [Pseudohongiella sp.]|nr:class I SAM-dependent methyltransferase [Pseudohongiella sp.]
MLNPSFSKALNRAVSSSYRAPDFVANRIVEGNKNNDTGEEYRLQQAFNDEIWLKLERAGLSSETFCDSDVLEVCAGTGFLTYHIIARCQPKNLTINDISHAELEASKEFISRTYPSAQIDWVLGDLHTLKFNRFFDIIIGNSFIHHFHDVPKVMKHFASMLKPGGVFISLHEPTPMAPVVEGAKTAAWPLAVLSPGFVNDIARSRHKGAPSSTDLWMFDAEEIKQVARGAGFSYAETIPWGLFRPTVVQRNGLHLSKEKPALSVEEERKFTRAVNLDALLNRFLPQRCFGSLTLVCRR